jgi:hypothetical protein
MDEANAKGLKWNRAQGGRTSTAELGPIGLLAWSGNAAVYAEVDINGDGPTLDHSEAAAEAKLRETYDALREHFDPVPVLRWEIRAFGGAKVARATVCGWDVLASADGWSALHAPGLAIASPRSESHPTCDESQRAAEAALRALGVSFRVEGA